jgi:hypothetical protein
MPLNCANSYLSDIAAVDLYERILSSRPTSSFFRWHQLCSDATIPRNLVTDILKTCTGG